MQNDIEKHRSRVEGLVRQGRFEDARVLEEHVLRVLIKMHSLEDERTIESIGDTLLYLV